MATWRDTALHWLVQFIGGPVAAAVVMLLKGGTRTPLLVLDIAPALVIERPAGTCGAVRPYQGYAAQAAANEVRPPDRVS